MELANKTILITGSDGGIGSALAAKLVEKGAEVVGISKDECDFSQQANVVDLVQKIQTKGVKIDMLINCAGIGVYKNISEVTLDEWNNSFAVNVTAPFILTQGLLNQLNMSEEPLVLNIGSGMGKIPTGGRSVYCATKYALRGWSLSLSKEFEGQKIKFCHITLGSTLTPFGPLSLEEKLAKQKEGKHYFTPEWVANKLVEILETNAIEDEITLYPSDYFGNYSV